MAEDAPAIGPGVGSEGGPAPVVGDTSEQDAARGSEGGLNTVVAEASGQDAAHASEEGEVGEGVGRTHTPPPTGSEWELDTPLDPPLRTYARRERVPEIERAVEELMHSTLTPIQEDLREARARLERSEREREILEVMVRTNTSPVGPAAGPERRTQSGGKAIQPREFSPKGNVGPAKWLFHMDLYFEYAHVYGNDRVHHGAILLRDAAESWWRSHVVATTDPQGAPTDGRLITWTDFATRLKAVFTPIPEKTQARRKLYDLRQVGSVQGYTLAFRELSFVLDDLSPAEAKSLYERGLKPKVWDEICLHFPKTLEETIALAEQADAVKPSVGQGGPARPTIRSNPAGRTVNNRFFARRARPQGARMNVMDAGGNRPVVAPVGPPVPRVGAAMAAVRPVPRRPQAAGRQPAGNAPAIPRDRLRREGRCFLCTQVGHLARDCPQENGPRR